MKFDTLQKNMIAAMKNKDNITRDAIRSIIANIKKAAIDKRCEITDALCDEILLKELKTINEMIETCPSSRPDLLADYAAKKAVICRFAPQLITDEKEIEILVREILAESNVTDENQIMKTVMPKLKGKVDMKIASQVLRNIKI